MLTKTMQHAITYAQHHGGILVRHPGGFWGEGRGGIHFGTPTAEALVSRGIARYTLWRSGKRGLFPVELKIVDPLPLPFVEKKGKL